MSSWPDTRILDLLGIELPIIQAPMAGATTAAMVIAANQAGALGSMPAAALSVEQLREALTSIRQAGSQPFNVNFFCHQPPEADEHAIDAGRNCWNPTTANWAPILMRRHRCPTARRSTKPLAK
jgi:NAD(P)H-dependent flavin oxidoreductase YrpB (nitropropane dioxygenase family)